MTAGNRGREVTTQADDIVGRILIYKGRVRSYFAATLWTVL